MKVQDEDLIEHQGNITPIARRRMGIDLDNIAHIIRPLTDLYSDKELACIREYSTNAFDAHVEAGTTAPIEIELPSQLKPVFVIRDHGVGLTMDEIIEHYGTYGFSSKRDTNEAVGMLGFGCKAALTYTNQFTLTAVKNGVRTTVLITRDTDGVGEIQVLDTMGTNEANGVEIQIPVRAPIEQFNQKAFAFFRFWEPGTVLVNSAPPPSYFDGEDNSNLFLDPDILIVKDDQLRSDYVVMGNVGYPCQLETNLRSSHVVARVAIGDVSFVPSREALQMDARTKEACLSVKEFVQERLEAHIQRQIDDQPDRKSAVVEAVRWNNIVYNWRKRPLYRGQTIPKALEMTGQSWHCGGWRSSANRQSYISTEDLVNPHNFVLLGHPPRSMLKETKQAISIEHPQARQVYVVHSMKKEHRVWLEAAQVINWDDIKPAAAPRAQRARNAKYGDGGGRWLVWQQGIQFSAQDIETDDDTIIIYALKSDSGAASHTRDSYRKHVGEYIEHASELSGDTFTFVLLGRSELERFVKLHPGALEVKEFFQQRVDQIMGELTADQFWWGERGHWALGLAKKNVLDPEVVGLVSRMVAAASASRLNQELKLTLFRGRGCTGWYPTLHGHGARQLSGSRSGDLEEVRRDAKTGLGAEMKLFDQNYPLARNSQDVTVEYINAVYLYRKGDCK